MKEVSGEVKRIDELLENLYKFGEPKLTGLIVYIWMCAIRKAEKFNQVVGTYSLVDDGDDGVLFETNSLYSSRVLSVLFKFRNRGEILTYHVSMRETVDVKLDKRELSTDPPKLDFREFENVIELDDRLTFMGFVDGLLEWLYSAGDNGISEKPKPIEAKDVIRGCEGFPFIDGRSGDGI